MAGESADEVARQARARAERLIRRARAFEKGAEGERIVATVLHKLSDEWFVLDDLQWPGRARANIDHVVVGPPGVFVIDAKNWSGAITISKGCLRQNGYTRRSTVAAAAEAAGAIRQVIPSVEPKLVTPVLCFVGDGAPTGVVDGVQVCSSASLLRVLQSRRRALGECERELVRFDLDMSTVDAGQSTQGSSPGRPMSPSKHVPARGSSTPPRPRRASAAPSAVARILLSFLAWWIGCAAAFWILGPATGYQASVIAPAELVVGGVCGLLVWRRLQTHP